jgi:hypothetical protein
MWVLWLAAALAADWPMLQGTEGGPNPAPIRPWGFVQVAAEGIVGGRALPEMSAEALQPFEGQRPLFNRVGTGDASWGFAIRRARLGLRGAIPKTDGRISWMIAAEAGDNGLTRSSPVVLTDASLTVSYIPGLQLRVGQFKLPLGEEALEMNPIAADFVNFSAATGQLLLENPAAGGAYVGGASGFRDVGVQAFHTFTSPVGEWSYALMLSNGRMGTLDLDNTKDLTHRLAWTWAWGAAEDPVRDEVGVYAFWQQGEREVEGESVDRIRRGGGVKLQRLGWQARVEVIQAAGAIELGASPPFPGQPVTVAPEGRAVGGHAFVHYTRGLLGGGVRYDELWRRYESPADLRVFRNLTLDAQVQVTTKFRMHLDYELRWLRAPEGNADASALGDTLGDRVSVQAAVIF